MRIVKLTEKTRENILSGLLKRNPSQYSEYEGTVREILDKVRTEGDKAVFEYTLKFDKTQEFSQIIEKFFNIAFSSHMRILLYKKNVCIIFI